MLRVSCLASSCTGRWKGLLTFRAQHISSVKVQNSSLFLVQVIRVCGSTARAMRTRMLDTLMETPSVEPGWRIGSPTQASSMHKVRSFVVLHNLDGTKKI